MTIKIDRRLAIEVQQSLFGYDDGHGLLASSSPLSPETLSLLYPLSDLVPGAEPSDAGYWTGIPILKAKVFALLRTWPAPEMPRPGCVWTHILLIRLSDLAYLPDLAVLRDHTRRPKKNLGFESYKKPFFVPIDAGMDSFPLQNSDNELLSLLRAVYGTNPIGEVSSAAGKLDDAVFALWSQQWPRLRRSFSFRTLTTSMGRISRTEFDLAINTDTRRREYKESDLQVKSGSWESIALQDLRLNRPTDFRRFVWRYGNDVRGGERRFRHLAKLYKTTRVVTLSGGRLSTVLADVSTIFPNEQDGLLLKNDLVSVGKVREDLLPPRDPLGILSYFIENGPITALPLPPEETREAVWDYWPSRTAEILRLGEQAIHGKSELREDIVSGIFSAIEPTEFLPALRSYPHLLYELVRRTPESLDSEYLCEMSFAEVATLLYVLPPESPVVSNVVRRLIGVHSEKLPSVMYERFPGLTLEVVAKSIQESISSGTLLPSDSWLECITRGSVSFLKAGIVERAQSTRTLAVYCSLLKYLSPAVLTAGPYPWARALEVAVDDIQGHSRQIFLAFLLGLALRQPRQGCEILFTTSFEQIYSDIAKSRLSEESFKLFSDQLPDLWWWEQWDTCQRLQKAVVEAYTEHGLAPESFARLTTKKSIRKKLFNQAKQTIRGWKMVESLLPDESAGPDDTMDESFRA